MRRMLVAVLATGTIAAGAPFAAAASDYDHRGGCELTAAGDGGGQQTTQGVLHALVVVFANDPARNPATAQVLCEVRVNGVTAASLSAAGTTVVARAEAVTFTAEDTAVVDVCGTVFYPDRTSVVTCRPYDGGALPPAVRDAADEVYAMGVDIVRSLVQEQVAPVSCPVLARLGGDYGPVVVTAEGDVFVVGDPVWDCPPYTAGPKPPPWAMPPPNYAGGIVISNFGPVQTWQRTGVLANSSWWSCSLTVSSPPTVTCNWVGGPTPKCRTQVVTAAVLPTLLSSGGMVWGTARTRSLCDFQQLSTAVANGSTGNQFKWNGISWAPTLATAYQIQCRADNGSNGAPVPQYVADCDFVF